MEQTKINFQIGRSYLKEKYKIVLAYGFIVTVFFLIAFLYGYEQIYLNMLYAVFLTLFFGVVFLAVDFLRYYGRCRTLFLALEQEEVRIENLPEVMGLQESLYQELLEEMRQEKRKFLTEYDEKKKDITDYYTMWTHQIKTPIAALRLLLQDDDAGEGGQCSRRRQAEREELFYFFQYAEMALYFARLDNLSSDLLFRRCDVQEIVKQAVRK